jgi:hypothetical protein
MLNIERINLFLETFNAIIQYVQFDSADGFAEISSSSSSGFYSASPVTFLDELTYAFSDIASKMRPSPLPQFVDSGPAFMVLNTGVLLSSIYYVCFIWMLRAAGVKSVLLIIIALITDFKFRSIFSVFVMFWLVINSAEQVRPAKPSPH